MLDLLVWYSPFIFAWALVLLGLAMIIYILWKLPRYTLYRFKKH